MTVDTGKTVDAVAAVIKAIGDTAQLAMKFGDPMLVILQDVGLFVPPVGVAANYLNVALPYIRAVAQYAPSVSAGLEQNKSLIEASVGVGSAVLSPLAHLLSALPELAQAHAFFADLDVWVKNNNFTPQDPRFDRGPPNASY